MKKSRIICMLICMILMVSLILVGCNSKKIVNKTVVDKQFIQEHFETVTEYKYIWNWVKADWTLVPDIKTKIMPDEWKFQINITYDDGTNNLEWISVDKNVFEKYEINENYVENYNEKK